MDFENFSKAYLGTLKYNFRARFGSLGLNSSPLHT